MTLAFVPQPRDLVADAAPASPARSGTFGSLGRWLLRRRAPRRTHLDSEPLDEHTLNDIGMTRFELIYWTRK